MSIKILIALLITVCSIQTNASLLAINNAGFEDFVLGDNFFTRRFSNGNAFEVITLDPIPGWTTTPIGTTDPTCCAGSFNPSVASHPGEAPEGKNVAYVSFARTEISQVLSHSLEVTTYSLEVEVGNRLDIGFTDYAIQLLAGGNLLAEDNNSLLPGNGLFETSTVFYTALPGDPNLGLPLEIRLIGENGLQVNFDNVRLSMVPIPAALPLFLSGLAILGFARSRKKNN